MKGQHVAVAGKGSFDDGCLLMNDSVSRGNCSERFLVLEAIIGEFYGIEKLGTVVFDALRLLIDPTVPESTILIGRSAAAFGAAGSIGGGVCGAVADSLLWRP